MTLDEYIPIPGRRYGAYGGSSTDAADVRFSGLHVAGGAWLSSSPAHMENAETSIVAQLARQLDVYPSITGGTSGTFTGVSADALSWTQLVKEHAVGVNTRTEAAYVPEVPAALLGVGLEDIADDFAASVPTVPHALRSVICNYGISRWIDYDATDVTSTGEPTAGTDGNKGYGANVLAEGEYVELAVPEDFPGGVVQVWLYGGPAGFVGTVSVTVDGLEVDTVDCGSVDHGDGVMLVKRYRLDAAAAAVRVTSTESNGAAVNGFGLEADPFPAVVVMNVPRLQAYSGDYAAVTDAQVAQFNRAYADVVSEFPDSVILADVDGFLRRRPELWTASGTNVNERGAALLAEHLATCLSSAARATGYPPTWKWLAEG